MDSMTNTGGGLKNMDWLKNLKPGLADFLGVMKSNSVPGLYKFSLSGDLYGPGKGWGLANSVFATKIRYMLGDIEEDERKNLAAFIASFQKKNGFIYDDFLRKKAATARLLGLPRTRNLSDILGIFNGELERAETRQSIAALAMLGEKPKYPLANIPKDIKTMERFLGSLDWGNPWGAGSHFSHLLFFLHYDQLFFGHDRNEELIDHAIEWIGRLQSEHDGCWYRKTVSNQLKVNGAMKVITGLDAAQKMDRLLQADKIIDTCLETINDQEACSHVNVVYVLCKCSSVCNHRRDEISKYLTAKLNDYKEYYYPKLGGFSFNKKRSGTHYLGARLSRGFDEPDIHGTVMFVWGITLISHFLGLDLGLREPIT